MQAKLQAGGANAKYTVYIILLPPLSIVGRRELSINFFHFISFEGTAAALTDERRASMWSWNMSGFQGLSHIHRLGRLSWAVKD